MPWPMLCHSDTKKIRVALESTANLLSKIISSRPMQPCEPVELQRHSAVSPAMDDTGVPTLVLVVEDESLVRLVAVDMLEDAGFTVVEAATADMAWTILDSRNDIGALFTDIEMPGSMNGFTLASRVAERWPHIRLVLTSGRCRPQQAEVPDHGRFVPKPYLSSQVLTALAQAGQG